MVVLDRRTILGLVVAGLVIVLICLAMGTEIMGLWSLAGKNRVKMKQGRVWIVSPPPLPYSSFLPLSYSSSPPPSPIPGAASLKASLLHSFQLHARPLRYDLDRDFALLPTSVDIGQPATDLILRTLKDASNEKFVRILDIYRFNQRVIPLYEPPALSFVGGPPKNHYLMVIPLVEGVALETDSIPEHDAVGIIAKKPGTPTSVHGRDFLLVVLEPFLGWEL